MADKLKVLLIEDDETDRQAVKRLIGQDFNILEAATGARGLELSQTARPDCVLLDYRLPDYDGLDLITRFRRDGDLPVVMLTGQANEFVAVELVQRGAEDFLSKDVMSRESICRAVANAIEKVGLRRELDALRKAVSTFLAETSGEEGAALAGLADALAELQSHADGLSSEAAACLENARRSADRLRQAVSELAASAADDE